MPDTFSLLSPKLRSSVGFDSPTSVQKKALPLILKGGNVLITAPTGSGKTEAAFLPVLDLYLKKPSKGIGILYITPLKALNRDIILRIERLADSVGLRAEVRHGDTSQSVRRKQTLDPPNILIITPETLQAVMCGKRLREHLKGVRFVVVDEVHEIAESKRGTQLAIGLERVVNLAGEFRRIGLSATVGDRKKVAAFLCGSRPCKVVNVSAAKDLDLRVESPVFSERMRDTSNALLLRGDTFARLNRIKELVAQRRSSLVFVNTRETAESLASRLIAWNCPIGIHHSSLGKEARIQTENDLKDASLKGVVCTSSLELGIDVGNIDLAVQYGSPRQVSKLIQRVGRSGHSISRRSTGVIIASDLDDICESAVVAKMALSDRLENQRIHELALDVLGNQIVGMVMEDGLSYGKAYSTVKRSYPFRHLSEEGFERVIAQLSDSRLVLSEEGQLRRRGRCFTYYFDNLSMIPDDKQYRVLNLVDRKTIGRLDEGFVAEYGKPGNNFICKGQAWSVVSLEDDILLVEPSGNLSSAIPSWEGELLPVPFEVAREVGRLRRLVEKNSRKAETLLIEKYPIDKRCASQICRMLKKQGIMPTDERVLVEGASKHVVLHTCLGSRANDTLGKMLCSVFSDRFGESIGVRFDPYRVIIELPDVEPGAPDEVRRILLSIPPGKVRPLVLSALEKSTLARLKSLQIAKKLGILRKDLDYQRISMRKLQEILEGTIVFDEVKRELLHDKLDIKVVSSFLRKLQAGKLELKVSHGFSPLCLDKLERFASLELISPKRPDSEILNLFKQRILQRRVELVCLNCGSWSDSFMIDSLPELPKCPKCTARLLALNKSSMNDAVKVVKKFLRGETLSKSEKAYYKRLRFSADLILTYGKKAVIALGGRGIGPKTGVRVLARMHRDEGRFLKDLLEQERLYARNRRFWA